jgi:hypothetical protein
LSGSSNKPGSGPRRFKPGKSGNPSGRPKDVHGIAALAREKSPQAIDRLLEIGLRGRGTAAVLALREILDRGLGRSAQSLDVTARRGTDVGAVGGDPDQARARLEALILAQASVVAGTTDGLPVAFPSQTELSQALGADDAGAGPTMVPGGPETESGAQS